MYRITPTLSTAVSIKSGCAGSVKSCRICVCCELWTINKDKQQYPCYTQLYLSMTTHVQVSTSMACMKTYMLNSLPRGSSNPLAIEAAPLRESVSCTSPTISVWAWCLTQWNSCWFQKVPNTSMFFNNRSGHMSNNNWQLESMLYCIHIMYSLVHRVHSSSLPQVGLRTADGLAGVLVHHLIFTLTLKNWKMVKVMKMKW